MYSETIPISQTFGREDFSFFFFLNVLDVCCLYDQQGTAITAASALEYF